MYEYVCVVVVVVVVAVVLALLSLSYAAIAAANKGIVVFLHNLLHTFGLQHMFYALSLSVSYTPKHIEVFIAAHKSIHTYTYH